jgi:hypothetical protein
MMIGWVKIGTKMLTQPAQPKTKFLYSETRGRLNALRIKREEVSL